MQANPSVWAQINIPIIILLIVRRCGGARIEDGGGGLHPSRPTTANVFLPLSLLGPTARPRPSANGGRGVVMGGSLLSYPFRRGRMSYMIKLGEPWS